MWGVLLCAPFIWGLSLPAAGAGPCAGSTSFLVGSGVYDITGPAVGVRMLGYAMLQQTTAGIHTRLRSRAFVIASPCNGRRIALVTADLAMICQAVRQQVLQKLHATYGDLYGADNLLLSATHTHSGPGGYSHYTLYNLTILGFSEPNFDAITEGIYQSIVRAHEDAAEGTIALAAGELLDAGINRSPEAYARNPVAERQRFGRDTDPRMTVLRLAQAGGREVGAISWFGVHATSMSNANQLISGDNKGYASARFERLKGTDYAAPHTFVAAFAQGSEGDVSPNIPGASGGGSDDFARTARSGQKQFETARALYDSATAPLAGGIDYRHAYVKMDEVRVGPEFADGQAHATCPASIGVSMPAGTEDGRGYGVEGVTCDGPASAWRSAVCALTSTACQGEKPNILTMGSKAPPWTPEVLPLQIATIGPLGLLAVPFEPTTMTGRRLQETIHGELAPVGVEHLVVVGLANAYAGYVATREEYAAQHYEGASTHFGPWTLAAYQQELARVAGALRRGAPLPPGPEPRDLSQAQIAVRPAAWFDTAPRGLAFGSVQRDAERSYRRGDTVRAVFWGGHLANDLRIQDTYLGVERRDGDGWATVARDWDWETRLLWRRSRCVPFLECSEITVEWDIPADAAPGTYRLRHNGSSKDAAGVLTPYTGTSREFAVR